MTALTAELVQQNQQLVQQHREVIQRNENLENIVQELVRQNQELRNTINSSRQASAENALKNALIGLVGGPIIKSLGGALLFSSSLSSLQQSEILSNVIAQY